MSQASIGFRHLSILEKIEKARKFVMGLTGNPFFPDPDPDLNKVAGAAIALENAHLLVASDGGKKNTANMRQCEDELDELIGNLRDYVQYASKGDEAKIRSANMDVRNIRNSGANLEQVEALHCRPGTSSGQIDLSWDPVDGARTYNVEKSADGANGWLHCGTSTRSKLSITNLGSEAKAWFRVAAVGSKGQGPWSSAAKGTAGE